ncbi:hypothetical protein Tco_1486439, partial [Tanacetum coccineum]
DDRSFARRLNDLLQEMESAYDEKVNFIRELEAVSGVDAAAKTADFLNENLWKDDKWVRKLRNMEMDSNLLAFEKEHGSRMRRLFALFSYALSSSSWDFPVFVVIAGLSIGVPVFGGEKTFSSSSSEYSLSVVRCVVPGRVVTDGSVFKTNEV